MAVATARTAAATRRAASPRRSGCPASRRRAAACAPRWRRRCCRPVGREVARRVAVDERGARAGEQRRAFVDLIERIRADDGGVGRGRIDHGLREREQRLARAVDRQHLRRRIERRRRSGAAPSRRSPRAAPARRRWPGSSPGRPGASVSASLDQRRASGGCGSPMPRLIGRSAPRCWMSRVSSRSARTDRDAGARAAGSCAARLSSALQHGEPLALVAVSALSGVIIAAAAPCGSRALRPAAARRSNASSSARRLDEALPDRARRSRSP